MNRRFVVAVQDFTPEQSKAFSDYLKGRFGWWHWIDNFWLVTTKNSEISTATMRDKLKEIAPGKRTLVMEFPEDVHWSGTGDKAKDMFAWLKETWAKD